MTVLFCFVLLFLSRSEKRGTVFLSDEANHRCLGDPFLVGSNRILQLTIGPFIRGKIRRVLHRTCPK